MILQALMEYYENLAEQGKLPRQGWCQAKVSYGINLSKSGDIKDIVWLKREEQMGTFLCFKPLAGFHSL